MGNMKVVHCLNRGSINCLCTQPSWTFLGQPFSTFLIMLTEPLRTQTWLAFCIFSQATTFNLTIVKITIILHYYLLGVSILGCHILKCMFSNTCTFPTYLGAKSAWILKTVPALYCATGQKNNGKLLNKLHWGTNGLVILRLIQLQLSHRCN